MEIDTAYFMQMQLSERVPFAKKSPREMASFSNTYRSNDARFRPNAILLFDCRLLLNDARI